MKKFSFLAIAVSIAAITSSGLLIAQNEGCVFLEGIELPCYGGGVACGGCADQYTSEEMANACQGTLPLTINDPACGSKSCGQKCCSNCDPNWDPAEHWTCENIYDCDESGNRKVCKTGTKELTCDHPTCQAKKGDYCGGFTCKVGCATVSCQGNKEKITCYSWPKKSVPSGGSCGCPNVGATPGTCNGSPTGAGECGGYSNPCSGTSENACLGKSTSCWTCTFEPGNQGTPTPTCYEGTATCYEGPPSSVQVCANSCTGGLSSSGTTPPGQTCDAVAPVVCSSDSECSSACP